MRILDLIIKGEWFDKIISGEKTEEFREIRPKNQHRYQTFDEVSQEYVPISYDAIRFFVGYNKDRKSAVVEVTKAEFEYVIDEETGDFITYEHEGQTYATVEMVYTLGKVLEKNF